MSVHGTAVPTHSTHVRTCEADSAGLPATIIQAHLVWALLVSDHCKISSGNQSIALRRSHRDPIAGQLRNGSRLGLDVHLAVPLRSIARTVALNGIPGCYARCVPRHFIQKLLAFRLYGLAC